MLSQAIFLFFLLFTTLLVAWTAAGRRLRLPLFLLYAALAFALILAVVNQALPFVGGGDDVAYYAASRRELGSLAEWLGVHRAQIFQQGGYPLVLAWVHQAVGDSLYARKALNLACYLWTVVAWFSIGCTLGDRRTGYAFALSLLLATPLWPYWMFVLKDMLVVLLQSLFLLGAVRVATGRATPGVWGLVAASTVLVIPLRLYLVLVNGAVLVITVVLLANQRPMRKVAATSAALVVLTGALYLGSSPAALRALGVAEARALDLDAVMEQTSAFAPERARFSGPLRMALFPVMFVFGETSGFRSDFVLAGQQDARYVRLRGVAALPWIFVGTPLMAYGLWSLLRGARRRQRRALIVQPRPAPELVATGGAARLPVISARSAPYAAPGPSAGPAPFPAPRAAPPARRAGIRPWLPLLVFLALYVVLAWMVADTTRWRMPAFPVMVAVAAQGWLWLSPMRRALWVLLWSSALSVLLTLYYVVLR